MAKAKYEALRDLVRHFHFGEANGDPKITLAKFKGTNISETSVRRYIKDSDPSKPSKWKKSPGRPPTETTPRKVQRVAEMFAEDPTTSTRQGAEDMGITQSSFQRIKKKRLFLKTYVQQAVPGYVGTQIPRAEKALRRLERKQFARKRGKVIVMDDETYVPVDPKYLPFRKWYSCSDKRKVDPWFRFKPKNRYFAKYCIWQAIGEDGQVSPPFVAKGTINGEIYRKECLQKRLIPWLKRTYGGTKDIVFWPDLASIHYTPDCRALLEAHGLEYVAKADNAPKVPQARPVEKFWAICKHRYSQRPRKAKDRLDLAGIWRRMSRKVAEKCGERLMKGVRAKVRKMGREGVHSVFK